MVFVPLLSWNEADQVIAPKPPQGVLVRGQAGRVIKKLSHQGSVGELSRIGVAGYDPFFFFTLVTGPGRSLSLDTRVYEPQIRARF